jgi:hypothetical protein
MSELFPAKTIALQFLSCTEPSREYEFNHWYNQVRIPNLRLTLGIENVYRYRNVYRHRNITPEAFERNT